MLLFLAGSATAAETSQQSGDVLTPFRQLAGRWECHGRFARSGAPIGASLVIVVDENTRSLLLHHDDLPPNGYHAIELWGPAKGGGLRAAIMDASSGMRWLTSPGWRDSALEWEREEGGQPKERFRYTLVENGRFKIDWFVIDAAGRAILGDSIICARA